MKRIIKRWEKALYYLVIIMCAGLFFYINSWAKSNDQIVKLDKVTLDNIVGYLFIIFVYILQWGFYKVVLNLLVLMGISMRYGHYLLLLFAMMNRYFESRFNKGYLDSKHFIVKHKMYSLEEIIAIKDNFGTNFTIYYETESYQIFAGSDLIKDEILSVLSDKRRIPYE